MNYQLIVYGLCVIFRIYQHWKRNKILSMVRRREICLGNNFFFIWKGLTIDRVYSLLEQCTDEQFLICLLTLLGNFFDERDTEILLPMFNSVKLITVRNNWFQKWFDWKFLFLDFGKNSWEKLSGRNQSWS
jgi:hypothetical protein